MKQTCSFFTNNNSLCVAYNALKFCQFKFNYLFLHIIHSYSFTKFSQTTQTLYICTYTMGAWSLSNQLFASLTAYLACILGGSYQHCYIHVVEWWVVIFYSIKKINLHICTQWYLSQGHELTANCTRFHHWPWSELMPSYSFLQSYILSYICVCVYMCIYTYMYDRK